MMMVYCLEIFSILFLYWMLFVLFFIALENFLEGEEFVTESPHSSEVNDIEKESTIDMLDDELSEDGFFY
jgi:hypothetical protein